VKPIVDGLEREYGKKIKFVRANILNDKYKSLMDEYGFSATPEFYLVDREGKILHGWSDMLDVEDVRSVFNQALADVK
jgi:hypothetical protein